jgi:hypothetical protein
VEGGFAADIGYTVTSSGRIKWALLRVLDSSPVVTCGWVWVGRNFEMREKKDCWVGGGRLRIDFPGVGIVTAEEEGA